MKRPYVIQFEQLALGVHEYDFFINEGLFTSMQNDAILKADIKVELALNKTANMMDMSMKFNGSLDVPCDRCNGPLRLNVKETGRLVVKFGQEEHQDLDDLIILDDHEYEIDLEHFFYENICLMIPARNIHSELDCDPEILAYLAKQEKLMKKKVDPRWEKLKGIQN